MIRMRAVLVLFAALAVSPLLAQERKVVVYVSHDQEHSEEILELFEKQSGIKVVAKFDTEDSKTVGLVSALLSERDNPQADVFWNNECGQAERLRREGVLAPYFSPNGESIPKAFKDPDGFWTGFAARARVLIYNPNTHQPADLPQTLNDLASPAFRSQVAMAKPLTGTTMTHAGALYATWGVERTENWLDAMIVNDTLWLAGNGHVAQRVAEGDRPFGLTDTDDVNGRRLDGLPVAAHFLGQGEDGEGTFVIPNSVMMIAGAQHVAEAKALIDFLLSPEVEARLAAGRAAQMPLHPGVKTPEGVTPVSAIKPFPVDLVKVGAALSEHSEALGMRFSRIGAGGKVIVTDDSAAAGASAFILLISVVGLLVVGLVVFAVLRAGGGGKD